MIDLHIDSRISGVSDDDPSTRVRRLRELAAWYRAFAERAGNPAIWDARLRTAEDLDAEASRIEQPTSAHSRTRTRGEDDVSDKPLTIDPVGVRRRDQESGSAHDDFKLLMILTLLALPLVLFFRKPPRGAGSEPAVPAH